MHSHEEAQKAQNIVLVVCFLCLFVAIEYFNALWSFFKRKQGRVVSRVGSAGSLTTTQRAREKPGACPASLYVLLTRVDIPQKIMIALPVDGAWFS
jgi:hypothetical protein